MPTAVSLMGLGPTVPSPGETPQDPCGLSRHSLSGKGSWSKTGDRAGHSGTLTRLSAGKPSWVPEPTFRLISRPDSLDPFSVRRPLHATPSGLPEPRQLRRARFFPHQLTDDTSKVRSPSSLTSAILQEE